LHHDVHSTTADKTINVLIAPTCELVPISLPATRWRARGGKAV
jgi:hypothetical protein